jgi:hypothetical protein
MPRTGANRSSEHGAIEDYEFWVRVPANEIHNLLFALLRDRYAGRSDAVDEFRAFCKKEGIN